MKRILKCIIVLFFINIGYCQSYVIEETDFDEERDDQCGQTTTQYQSTQYYLQLNLNTQNIPSGYNMKVTAGATIDGNRCDVNEDFNRYVAIDDVFCTNFNEYYSGCCEYGDVTFRIIPSGLNLIQPTNNTSDRITLNATAGFHSKVYQWEFFDPRVTDADKWRPIPDRLQGTNMVSVTAQDLFGAAAATYMGRTIQFRIRLCNGWTSGQIVNYVFIAQPPNILGITTYETKCSYTNDGKFRIQLDRRINAGNQLNFNLFKVKPDGSNDLEITPSVSGQSGAIYTSNGKYYFDWPNGLAPGKHRLQYQLNASGGVVISNVFEIAPASAVTFTVSKIDPKCPSDKGSITISANGGTGPYQYSKDDGNSYQNSNFFTGLESDNYTIRVRDSKECRSASTSVFVDPAPKPITIKKIEVGPVTFNGGNNGSIDVTVGGGTSPYIYNWSGPPGGYDKDVEDIAMLETGIYTLTVTDANGCIAIKDNIEVKEPARLTFNPVNVSPIDCYGRVNGVITISGSGGLPNYRFELLKDNGASIYIATGDVFNTNTLDIPFIVTDLPKGNYKVRLTDNIGTTNPQIVIESEIVEIKEPAPVEFTITSTTNVLCKEDTTGAATVTITGGWGNYITEWYKDGITLYSTEQNPTNLIAGTYILIVKGATSNPNSTTCPTITPIAEGEITITEPTEKLEINTIRITSPVAGNANGGITMEAIGGVGPYTYLWNTGETVPSITNISDGTYTITTTDSNECTAVKEYVVEELSVTIFTTPGEELLCHGNLAGLTANPVGGDKQYTYAWYNQNDLTTILGTESTIQGLTEGNYIVTVTDTNGSGTLVTSPSFSIVEPTLLEYDVSTTAVTCYEGKDGTLTINATGGTPPLQYSIDNGINYQSSNMFTDLTGGLYPVLVKDANNCSTDEKNHLVYVPDSISIVDTVTHVGIFDQNTGAIELEVSGGNGGYTYSWTSPNGFTATSRDITNLYIGTYTVVIKDANFDAIPDNAGCTTTQTFTITQPDKLEVVMGYETLDSDLKCYGDDNARLLATVTGGVEPYSYTWLKENTSGGYDTLADNSSLFIGADAGTYRVDITDVNTASVSSDVFVISQPDALLVEYTTIKVICFGDATGAIDLTVSGGTPPYTIAWQSGEGVEDRENLVAGTYTVEVKDSHDCVVRKDIEVAHAYQELVIADIEVHDVSVFDGADGAIALDITGGAIPYTIIWTRISDGSIVGNTDTITGLKAGDYHVSITDKEGCSIEQTYSVAEPDIVVATLVDPVCIDDCNGSISIVVDEGNGNFTYLWSTGETTDTITGLCEGTYSVIIEGYGNRILERTYTLKDPAPLVIGLGEDKTLCKDQTYILDATIDDPLAIYEWQADNGFTASTARVELSESGMYTVIVTTGIGCVSSESIQITATDTIIVSDFIVSSDLFIHENFTVVNLSSPVPDSIEWDIPDTAEIIENTPQYAEIKFAEAGEYKIGLRTHLGDCEEYATKTILVRERSLQEDENPIEGLQEYVLFPNPTSGNFTVNLTFDTETAIDLKLFNVANNTMISHHENSGATTYAVPFELAGILPSGIYFLMLEIPGKSYVRKIVIE